MRALVVPFKDPSRGKTRLAALLTARERARLAWAMFEDASVAASDARQPDKVVLVSSYQPAIDRARTLGWEVLTEESQQSESASVDWASAMLAARGFDTVMRLPADLPLVRAEDIDEIFSIKLSTHAALLVPSRDGSGTNAIVRTPPNLFPSRFGPNSLALHKAEASKAGAECLIRENHRIALDVDEPADIALVIERTAATSSTFAALAEMKIEARVGKAS
jgi:2-phospho-L-lactate/phosphoenolpyruvate guanylyltransferase